MKEVFVILGPTGVGKSALGIALAKQIQGEIISADSMQVYRGLNVGTAKITHSEMQGIQHHLIDIKNFDESYNAFQFVVDAKQKIDEIIARHHTPIIVGGTNLYITALVRNYTFDKSGIFEQCYQLKNDVKFKIFAVNLEPRSKLYEKINLRVDVMMKQGLLNEVETLKKQGLKKDSQAGKSIGYREIFEYFDGICTLNEAVDKIKQHSRNFAKRQLTWLRGLGDMITWIDANLSVEEKIKIMLKK